MQTFRIYMLLALVALAILVFNNRNKTVALENKHTSEIQQQQEIQKDYKTTIAVYKTKSDSLEKQLSQTQSALEKQTVFSRNAVQKLKQVLADRTDQKGDSLYDAASDYQIESEKTDSLKDQKINNLERMNRQKEDAIIEISGCYDEANMLLDNALKDLEACEKSNATLQKKTTWQKIKDGLLIILTTATTTLAAAHLLK